MVREAAGKGAQVVLPPELFEGEYFCRVEDEGLFAAAKPTAAHPSVIAMQRLADDLGIWIPTSFFEADGPHHYNSLAMIAPGGTIAGGYRKSHIPDGPGYEEKIGRAHVRTPVTNAHIVSRLLLEKKKHT